MFRRFKLREPLYPSSFSSYNLPKLFMHTIKTSSSSAKRIKSINQKRCPIPALPGDTAVNPASSSCPYLLIFLKGSLSLFLDFIF